MGPDLRSDDDFVNLFLITLSLVMVVIVLCCGGFLLADDIGWL